MPILRSISLEVPHNRVLLILGELLLISTHRLMDSMIQPKQHPPFLLQVFCINF
jgi:hypothetical protein